MIKESYEVSITKNVTCSAGGKVTEMFKGLT